MSKPTLQSMLEEEEEEEDVSDTNLVDGSTSSANSGDLREKIAREKSGNLPTDVEAEGSETDLELEEEKTDYDLSGKTTYLSACRLLGVVPVSYFLRHMTSRNLMLGHHGLGALGAKALSYPLQTNTSVLVLDLQDNWLEGEGGEYIAEMLKENCYISELNVSNNKLGSKGCFALCKMLHTNITLQKINMSANDLNDNDTPCISEALFENNRLKTLNLSCNSFGGEKSGTILGDAISENETVEELDLSWNNFRLKSGLNICHGIASNSRLRVVNLSMNGLGNEGAFGIAEILKQTATVTELDVSHNRIGVPGATAIGKALEPNDLLKKLKIGHNPLGLEGIKLVFKGVAVESSCVTELDISGIEVDKDFRTMKEELQANRDIKITHGNILSDYIIVGKPKKKLDTIFSTPIEEITADNIMSIIKTYCDVNGINLYDSLGAFDKAKERKVSWSEMMTAFMECSIELTTSQTDFLDNLLSEAKSLDGRIDYSVLK